MNNEKQKMKNKMKIAKQKMINKKGRTKNQKGN